MGKATIETDFIGATRRIRTNDVTLRRNVQDRVDLYRDGLLLCDLERVISSVIRVVVIVQKNGQPRLAYARVKS